MITKTNNPIPGTAVGFRPDNRNSRCSRQVKQSRSIWRICLVVMVVAFACPPTPSSAQEGNVKAQYGEWQVVCKKPAGAKKEICAAVQSVTAENRPNVGLTVYLQKFSDGKQVIRVFAPLGILLPTGIGLKIDEKDVGHAPFLRCHSFACYAQVTADDKLLSKLANGKTAMFIIFQTEEAGIGIPVSLNGLKTAMKSLQ